MTGVTGVTGRAPARAPRLRSAWPVVAAGVVGWVTLVAWDASPWGRYLEHDAAADAGLAAPAAVAVFVAGWVLMLAAMMLPTTRPVMAAFEAVVARRDDATGLLGLAVTGYLTVWVGAGLVALAADGVVHGLDDRYGLVGDRGWVLAAGALAMAGAFQLSGLKERCLTACRSPRLQVATHWRGRQPGWDAFSLGVGHGWSCLGCCWALMVVMFAIGGGNLGWMLVLGAVMAVEKGWRHGHAVRVPVAVALWASAAVVVGVHL